MMKPIFLSGGRHVLARVERLPNNQVLNDRAKALYILFQMHPGSNLALRRIKLRQALNLAGITLSELAEVVAQGLATGLTPEQLQLKFKILLQPEDVAAWHYR